MLFQRLYELFEAVEAFFGLLGRYFPLQGKKAVSKSKDTQPRCVTTPDRFSFN